MIVIRMLLLAILTAGLFAATPLSQAAAHEGECKETSESWTVPVLQVPITTSQRSECHDRDS